MQGISTQLCELIKLMKGIMTDLRAGLGTSNLICTPGSHDVTTNSLKSLCLLVGTHTTVVQAINFIADLGIFLEQRPTQSLPTREA